MKTLVSIVAFISCGTMILANDCRVRAVVHAPAARVYSAPIVHSQAYAAPAYVAPVAYNNYVATYVAVPLVVPAYNVFYGGNDNGTKDEILRLRDEIRSMRDTFRAPAPVAPMQPPVNDGPIRVPANLSEAVGASWGVGRQMPNPTTGLRQQGQVLHDGVKILTASCSKCHDGTIAKTKGGGVVLTEGGVLVALTDSQMLAIVREIYSGRMPKGSKLTDADVGTVIEWVDTRK